MHQKSPRVKACPLNRLRLIRAAMNIKAKTRQTHSDAHDWVSAIVEGRCNCEPKISVDAAQSDLWRGQRGMAAMKVNVILNDKDS